VYGMLTCNEEVVTGAVMTTTWHFSTGDRHCDNGTEVQGLGWISCTLQNVDTAPDPPITLDVVMTWQGHTYTGQTTFPY
jgi:hypothetical protein